MIKPVSSLFLSFLGSNPGFAIEPLESMFCRAALELSGGDPTRVHFAFPSLDRGAPRNLPPDINVIRYDFNHESRAESERLLEYVRKHDIQLVQFFDMQIVHPLLAKLRKVGVSTIISYLGSMISGLQPKWKYLLKRLEVTLSRSRLDAVIFESQAMADLGIYGRGIPRHLVDIVPLGVDVSVFHPQDSHYVYTQFGLPRDRRIVVYSGHVIRRKGIHILIEAAVELLAHRGRKDVCFLICGNRNGDSKEFEPIYAGKGLDSFIRFAGYRSDMKDIFSGSFCGVIPSVEWDSFTLTSIEMAACGLPIVASRLQGLKEAIVDGTTGILYTPGNAEELADNLQALLDNPNRAEELGRNGRRRCEAEFTLEIQFQRYLAALKKRLPSSL
jgi:glycosyltransferase involved in cell wall biosynthesis